MDDRELAAHRARRAADKARERARMTPEERAAKRQPYDLAYRQAHLDERHAKDAKRHSADRAARKAGR